jgi:hypothetical protein
MPEKVMERSYFWWRAIFEFRFSSFDFGHFGCGLWPRRALRVEALGGTEGTEKFVLVAANSRAVN